MAAPLTFDQVQARLDTIDAALSLYLSNPEKFVETIGGSIKLSIPAYIAFLQKEREHYQTLSNQSPYWNQSYVEDSL